MQTFFRQFSTIGGFTLLVLLLIVNASITGRRLNVLVENQGWVDHSRQVLAEMEEAQALLLDAETGQRGFLLTGEPSYLEPYNKAVSQVDIHIQNLSGLTVDNPRQQANVAHLGSLAHMKLNELEETIALAQAGHADQARGIVLAGRG